MAVTNYAELQTAITNWMARSDLSGDAAEFIELAEKRLNRELRGIQAEQTLTGIAASRDISLTAYSVDEPLNLFITDGSDEYEVAKVAFSEQRHITGSARPRNWSVYNNDTIRFDRALDQAYPFRLIYEPKFALSDAVTTNWLLDNHSDVYLAASIVWGGMFTQDIEQVSMWASVLMDGVDSINLHNARFRKGRLHVDPALASTGGRRSDFETGYGA